MNGTTTKQIKPRRTGYSLFCMEKANSEEFKQLTRSERLHRFGESWRTLGQEQRALFRARARSLPIPTDQKWRKKEWTRTTKKILSMIDKLKEIIPTTEGYLVLSAGSEIMSYGTSKGSMFLNEYPGLATESFRAFLNQGFPSSALGSEKVTINVIQTIFNEKYSDACGVRGRRMPYSSVKQGLVKMEGMPPGVLLRHPSSYGPRQLRAIFAAKDELRCVINHQGQPDGSS
ncbi:general transcription factor II-I repeat domain-containing protein 1-like [Apostichopus japonicus]|uniref:general transcription factor II-I repeat domain-containing protein 1-like n=1 Tax=Stichopus japonicus TaxID=307972 RepID=UPI003AB2BAB3